MSLRNIIIGLAVVALVVLLGSSSKKGSANKVGVKPDVPKAHQKLVLPPHAADEQTVSLGTKVDPVSKKTVEGIAFIHYKKDEDRTKEAKGTKGAGSTCYSLLSKGARWKTLEPWIVNPNNIRGLGTDFIFENLGLNIGKWETAALGKNILGDGTSTGDPLIADTVSPDGQNEAYFADISSPGAIAVTIVWGIFSGSPQNRELVEWDQVYDDADFDWSSAGEAGKMDFENITTHELGHAAGMGHPSDSCTEETMYRFSSNGETKKRDLNTGDIAGIKELYK
jgi:hypothetical protein